MRKTDNTNLIEEENMEQPETPPLSPTPEVSLRPPIDLTESSSDDEQDKRTVQHMVTNIVLVLEYWMGKLEYSPCLQQVFNRIEDLNMKCAVTRCLFDMKNMETRSERDRVWNSINEEFNVLKPVVMNLIESTKKKQSQHTEADDVEEGEEVEKAVESEEAEEVEEAEF